MMRSPALVRGIDCGAMNFMTMWHRLARATTSTLQQASWKATLQGVAGRFGLIPTRVVAPEDSVAFTVALIALSAKLANSDGAVVAAEVSAFHDNVRISKDQRARIDRMFDLAAESERGFELYAERIAELFGGDKQRLQVVLEGLLHIATADKALHPDEDAYLADVASRFGFTPSQYAHFRCRFVDCDRQDPYSILGLGHDAGEAEIKARYRSLVTKNHPDKLIAANAPAEIVDAATRKMQTITEAYRVIATERGIK